jgi:hypothetical protein
MKDPDYPIEIAKTALKDEKTKLARIEADVAAARGTTTPSWNVDDYRTALRDGLGDIAGLLDIATDDEKNTLYQLLGLELTYTRTGPGSGHLAAALRPRLEPRGAVLRVGGPSCGFTPTIRLSTSWSAAA